MENETVTKRGKFGKVQVTIPFQVKDTMMLWCKNSGLGKAEFFRVALMIGVSQLAEQVNAKDQPINNQISVKMITDVVDVTN